MSKRYNKQIVYNYTGNIASTAISTGNLNVTGNIYKNEVTFVGGGGGSDWISTIGGTMHYTRGNVGIGTTSPSTKLQVTDSYSDPDIISASRTDFILMTNNPQIVSTLNSSEKKLVFRYTPTSYRPEDFTYINSYSYGEGYNVDAYYAIKYTGVSQKKINIILNANYSIDNTRTLTLYKGNDDYSSSEVVTFVIVASGEGPININVSTVLLQNQILWWELSEYSEFLISLITTYNFANVTVGETTSNSTYISGTGLTTASILNTNLITTNLTTASILNTNLITTNLSTGNISITGDIYKNGSLYASAAGGASNWLTTGGNTFITGGNIGIGTTAPSSQLQITTSISTGTETIESTRYSFFPGIQGIVANPSPKLIFQYSGDAPTDFTYFDNSYGANTAFGLKYTGASSKKININLTIPYSIPSYYGAQQFTLYLYKGNNSYLSPQTIVSGNVTRGNNVITLSETTTLLQDQVMWLELSANIDMTFQSVNSSTFTYNFANVVSNFVSSHTYINGIGMTTGSINLTGDIYKNGTLYGSSNWLTTGGNTFITGGNVGIGTTAPSTQLQISSIVAGGSQQVSSTRSSFLPSETPDIQPNLFRYPGTRVVFRYPIPAITLPTDFAYTNLYSFGPDTFAFYAVKYTGVSSKTVNIRIVVRYYMGMMMSPGTLSMYKGNEDYSSGQLIGTVNLVMTGADENNNITVSIQETTTLTQNQIIWFDLSTSIYLYYPTSTFTSPSYSTPPLIFDIADVTTGSQSSHTYISSVGLSTGNISITGDIYKNGSLYASAAGGASNWLTTGGNTFITGGNVGIGTTVPRSQLSLTNDFYIAANSSTWGNLHSKGLFMRYSTWVGQDAGYIQSITRSSSTLHPLFLEASKINLNVSGNVGVSNEFPSYKLDVSGDINFTGNLYQNGSLFSGGGGSGTINGNLSIGNSTQENYIVFYGTFGDNPGGYNHTYIGERKYAFEEKSELLLFKGNDVTTVSDDGPDRIRLVAPELTFDTNTSNVEGTFEQVAATGTTRMIIKSGGNVGIGNVSPNYKLDVSGDINFTGNLYQNGSLFSSGGGGGSGVISGATTTFSSATSYNVPVDLTTYRAVDIIINQHYSGTGGVGRNVTMQYINQSFVTNSFYEYSARFTPYSNSTGEFESDNGILFKTVETVDIIHGSQAVIKIFRATVSNGRHGVLIDGTYCYSNVGQTRVTASAAIFERPAYIKLSTPSGTYMTGSYTIIYYS